VAAATTDGRPSASNNKKASKSKLKKTTHELPPFLRNFTFADHDCLVCQKEINKKEKDPEKHGPFLVAKLIKVKNDMFNLTKLGVYPMPTLAKQFGCKGIGSSN
jgi:hypothetical protein